MNQAKQTRLARIGIVGSIAAAFGASVCCIGPIVAVIFGMSSLAALARYEPLRPIFGLATAVFLSVAFYATYKRPDTACESRPVCAAQGTSRMQKMNRFALWTGMIVALVVFTFPAWSAWVLG